MKFNEPNKEIITVPKYKNCFIYFLLEDNEVVYVGRTHNGIYRPFSHKDKIFNEIKILYCDENNLDLLEDSFIQKYKPKYNKQRNYAVVWSLLRVRNAIRKQTGISNYTIPKLKKLLMKLDITPAKDNYTGKYIITFDEYETVMSYFREIDTNEIHH